MRRIDARALLRRVESITDELAREVFIHGPVVVFRWRNEPGWPVELCTPNVVEVFGHSASAFVQGEVTYASCVHPEDLERVAREVTEATESGAATLEHEPYRIRRADGSVRWLYDFTSLSRDAHGVVTHYLGYVIDVTARVHAMAKARELELRLLHAQKLESLGVLAGGVAHDFNNLLTGILGQANLAQLAVANGSPTVLEHLQQIEELSLRAAAFTRQLLAYTGKGHIVVEPVDLGELLRSMTSMLRVLVSTNATLLVDVEPTVPMLLGDRTQLQQVVMNLVTNASEALEGGPGTITLRASSRRMSSDELESQLHARHLPPGEYVLFEVSDDGCGMNAETAERLFEPFYTTKTTGRGLGMSAVMGIVRGHHGAIHVESELGRGTTFRLAFPMSRETARPRAASPSTLPWRGSGLALVVDDEAPVRRAACSMLQHLGFTTCVAENGADALAMLEERGEEIVVVVLDRTMPVLNGAETLRRLRQKHPTLPVVMTSGFDVGAPTQLVEPYVTFLPKPYRIAELQTKLREALSGH